MSLDDSGTHLALDYLDALMAEYVLATGSSVKTADVAREVGERIGASARLVRNELTNSQRLTLVDRRWDLKARHEPRRRSVDGTLQFILKEHGKPLPIGHLAQELAVVKQSSREDLLRVVERLVRTRETFFMTSDGDVGLRSWLLDVDEDDEDDRVRQYNFFGVKLDLDAVLDRLAIDDARTADDEVDGLVTLINSADEPIATRLLLYALWRARGRLSDPAELLRLVLRDDRVRILPGPALATPQYVAALAEMIEDLSATHDAEAAGAEAVLDIEDILDSDAEMPEEFELGSDDVTEVQRIINDAGDAMTLANVVSDVFELFPGDLQYAAAVRAVSDALKGDDRFVELPDHRWHLRVLLPPTLFRVPVTLQLSPVSVVTLTGDLVDAPLNDAGLEGGLEWEVRAPDLEDIGEENEVPPIREGISLAQRQRFVTTYRHFVSGTVKVRKIDRGVFPIEPDIRPISLVDKATGGKFELWLNNTTGLLCGLDEWYKGRLQPAGHVFFLEVDATGEQWSAEIDAEPDVQLLIPQPRLDELLVLRVHAEHAQDVSVLEIMRQLMERHPNGVSFRRLYTECNIVRRVSKRIIASNLSSYPMFSLNENETLWLYNERKSNAPRDPAKLPFVLGAEEQGGS